MTGWRTTAHVNGPADVDETADPIFILDLDNPNNEFGGAFTMTDEQFAWYEDGLLYLDLHSDAYPTARSGARSFRELNGPKQGGARAPSAEGARAGERPEIWGRRTR